MGADFPASNENTEENHPVKEDGFLMSDFEGFSQFGFNFIEATKNFTVLAATI
jgi:hypothetical protein